MSNETPMAVMSTVRVERCRKGLYASFSITTPSTAHTDIDNIKAAKPPTMDWVGNPSFSTEYQATNAPSMNTSLWAKLMKRSTPYTMVYPSAIRA